MHRIRCLRSNSTDSYTSVNNQQMESKRWPKWKRIALIIAIVLFSIAFLLFLAIWVVFPLVFMNSISLQRHFMFFNSQSPTNPEFNNPEKYNMEGVVNFYITTVDQDNATLLSIGAWMIVPKDEISTRTFLTHNNQTASEILKETKKPILLYLHGVGCNRIKPIQTYGVVRKYFLIISLDHRGYGDSGSNVVLSELGIVSDTAQAYSWIRSKTKNDIFVWGHSLGAAIATHTVRRLKESNIVPMGLVLESPFSTMRDEVYSVGLADYFRWLAYFNQTFLDPLERNGFCFKSTTNILYVDCPVMIMHAEDDNVIPYRLGKKLYETAQSQRTSTQGTVTYHQFPPVGYKHVGIVEDPEIPKFIETFMNESRAQNKMRN